MRAASCVSAAPACTLDRRIYTPAMMVPIRYVFGAESPGHVAAEAFCEPVEN
jgi:hypothetical protein